MVRLRYKGKNRLRKFINSYITLSLLGFEFFINLYCSNVPFFKRHKKVMDDAFKGTVCICQDIKMKNDYKNFKYDRKILREAFRKEENINSIKNIFLEDVIKDYAEVGGFHTLDRNSKLQFHAIDDKFTQIVSKLDSYRYNLKGFIQFYESNKEAFDEIENLEKEEWEYDAPGFGERNIKKLKDETKKDKVKLKILNSVINNYKIMRDNSHFISGKDFIEHLSENLISGKFIANFHCHTLWMEPPSDNDLEKSKDAREIVYVLNSHGFDAYVLEKGEIIDKVEYRNEKEWGTFYKNLMTKFRNKKYRGGC